MKLPSFSLILSLGLALGLTACGGGGGGTGTKGGDDSVRGDLSTQQQSSIDSAVFYTKVAPQSITEQNPLIVSGPTIGTLQKQYLISTVDQAKDFNANLSQESRLTFDDLANTAYLLIAASACPGTSSLSDTDIAGDQVTIRINRSQSQASCNGQNVPRYHVFKAAKFHAPEILFESVPGVTRNSSPVTAGTERTVLVTDATEWTALWAANQSQSVPQQPLPPVDFSKDMVVGIYAGGRPTGCYGLGVDRIYQSSGKHVVEYTEWLPPADAICTQAIVFPVQLVVLPRTSDPFEFVKATRLRS